MLIALIEREAGDEAERLLEEARTDAERTRSAGKTKSDRILEEAERKAASQVQRIERQSEARIAAEMRRRALRRQEEVFQQTLKRVRTRLQERVGRKDYRDILLGWIVEALIGLRAGQSEVNASRQELRLIDDALLRRAERNLEELTGRHAALALSDGEPLLAQGVVVSAADGALVFDNRVQTRLLRYQSEIRSMVHGRLAQLEGAGGESHE